MELILKNVSSKPLYGINLKLTNGITGIVGDEYKSLILALLGINDYSGDINIDNDKIFYIEKELNKEFSMPTVKKYIEFSIKYYGGSLDNLDYALDIFEVDKSYLDKKFNELSTSDEKILQFILSILVNKDVLILEDPFIYIDGKHEKDLISYLNQIKTNKIIILITNNSNKIYKYTDSVVVLKDNTVLIHSNTNDLYHRVSFLRKNKISIPDTVLFTSKANNKKIDIKYHKDIRDLIKDVYKHV